MSDTGKGRRDPIHLGEGEPVLLLHPFLLSQSVWDDVAPRLADTGRYEVFAPTMAGHRGGPRSGTIFLDTSFMADHLERQLDELGWQTAHLVGNSLGGWVAFELNRRGRARSVTAIAPGGGWDKWTPVKFEIIVKFLAMGPVLLAARLMGPRILRLPFARRLGTLALSATPAAVSEADLLAGLQDATHCPAYLQMLIKSLTAPGLQALAESSTPALLVNCQRDRMLPAPRFTRLFVDHVAGLDVVDLDGVGHVPMLEAPQRIAETVLDFLDRQTRREDTVTPAS